MERNLEVSQPSTRKSCAFEEKEFISPLNKKQQAKLPNIYRPSSGSQSVLNSSQRCYLNDKRTAPSSYVSLQKYSSPEAKTAYISIIFSVLPCFISAVHLFSASGSVVSTQDKIKTDLSIEYRTLTQPPCPSSHSTSSSTPKTSTPLRHLDTRRLYFHEEGICQLLAGF